MLRPSLALASFLVFATTAFANGRPASLTPAMARGPVSAVRPSAPAEFDPFAPDAEEKLRDFDEAYAEQTGQSPFNELFDGMLDDSGCYRENCNVWIYVSKASQRLYLYLNGTQTYDWAVSTGVVGRATPDFDRHPNGRIYDRYSSAAYPGGDYNGLGNMPYAVFIEGGFALHGTPRENWSKLGQRASHGCIRQHPDNARYLNRLVRRVGVRDVWVTVE